jgi:hypothetical protein
MMALSLRPVFNSSAVSGLLGALTPGPIEESAGSLAGSAMKSYTQICLGRASPGLAMGVCWAAFVEAHPESTAKAKKIDIARLRVIIANLPLGLLPLVTSSIVAPSLP